MPRFTQPNGAKITIPANEVARARPTLTNEIYEHPGHVGSALFSPKQLVMEPIQTVGPALQAERPSFDRLTGVRNRELWFDGKKARDAQRPRPRETGNGVRAIVVVGGTRMRVLETVAAAQAVIDAARGDSLATE